MPVGSTTSLRNWNEQIRRLAHAALDLLFPPRCVVCRKPGTPLCPNCICSFERVQGPVCPTCGDPQPHGDLCPRCLRGRTFKSVRSAFQFTGGVRQAVHAFKYERRRELAGPLARAAADVLAAPDQSTHLCAVPLHPTRLAQRGYNQAWLIAEQLAEIWTSSPVLPERALVRTRNTASQVDLDFAARRTNVNQAFCADSAWVAQRAIILVDDVCTTGATLDACAAALMDSGAISVQAITLARAV